MSPEVLDVERALLALAPQERASVIHSGLLSLEDDVLNEADAAQDTEIDAVWRDEFRRRIDDIESGRVELLSGEEVDARVQALLAELRR